MTSRMAASTLRIGRRLGRRLLVVLAVLALVTPTALRVVAPDGAGWLAGHGHLFLTTEAATHAHTHPWDDPAASDTPVESAPTPGVVFTLGDLDAASSLAMVALPSMLGVLAVAWLGGVIGTPVVAPAGVRARPLVPPPQR